MIYYTNDLQKGVVHLIVAGKVKTEDIDKADKAIEGFIKENGGSLRGMLLEMQDFEGYASLEAFVHDYRFIKAHQDVVGKIAMVGKKKWQEWMVAIFKPFVKAEQRYFDTDEVDKAIEWLGE